MLSGIPDARLRVLVVWEPVLRTDFGGPLTQVLGLLRDGRVAQYWDPERVVSAEIVRAVNESPSHYGFDEPFPSDFVVWDVVSVFSKSASWHEALPVPTYFGGPVMNVVEETRAALSEANAGN